MRAEISLRIEYVAEGQRRTVEVNAAGDARPASFVRELGLVTRRSGQTWRALVTPRRELTVESIVATLACDVRSADAVYLNGYESWTDSRERSPWANMPGLTFVPNKLVSSYKLDWSGDYRFTRQSALPGHQHGFGYAYLRHGEKVLLAGSLDENSGFTTIRSDAYKNSLTFEKEPPAHALAASEEHELMGLFVGEGTLDGVVDDWLGCAGIRALPARKLIGYTSWYRHYGDISEKCLLSDLEGLASTLGELEHDGADLLFQVDDGYAKVGDWLRCDAERFPNGMAPIAAAAHEQGYHAGIWLAPFICEKESRLAAEHPDWIVEEAPGSTFNWSGALILDTQNPEVRSYVSECLRTVTQDWGYDLLKLDFLFAACMVPHNGLNRGELMADAVSLIRESVAPGTRLLFCGIPMLSAFGTCEYCRVGCDVGLDWDDKPHMRLLHRERVSTKNSLANARGRAHLNGRAFGCDPDVFFLRDDVELTDAQRAEMLETDATCGKVLLTSDDMGAWSAEQHERYRELVRTFLEN